MIVRFLILILALCLPHRVFAQDSELYADIVGSAVEHFSKSYVSDDTSIIVVLETIGVDGRSTGVVLDSINIRRRAGISPSIAFLPHLDRHLNHDEILIHFGSPRIDPSGSRASIQVFLSGRDDSVPPNLFPEGWPWSKVYALSLERRDGDWIVIGERLERIS